MSKQYTEQQLDEIFAPRRAMEAIDRTAFRAVETSDPEAGCTGCHFEGKDCPHEFNIAGWDCTPGANLVFIKRASARGALLKLIA